MTSSSLRRYDIRAAVPLRKQSLIHGLPLMLRLMVHRQANAAESGHPNAPGASSHTFRDAGIAPAAIFAQQAVRNGADTGDAMSSYNPRRRESAGRFMLMRSVTSIRSSTDKIGIVSHFPS